MIYKNCIDACFECVKACERYSQEELIITKEPMKKHDITHFCADFCTLIGRTTARGLCCAPLFELCAKYCDECVEKCEKVDHEYARACVEAAKKCAEACRQCKFDCEC